MFFVDNLTYESDVNEVLGDQLLDIIIDCILRESSKQEITYLLSVKRAEWSDDSLK